MHTHDCATWKHPSVEILFLQGMLFKYKLNVRNHLGTSVKEASHVFQMSRKHFFPKRFEAGG